MRMNFGQNQQILPEGSYTFLVLILCLLHCGNIIVGLIYGIVSGKAHCYTAFGVCDFLLDVQRSSIHSCWVQTATSKVYCTYSYNESQGDALFLKFI